MAENKTKPTGDNPSAFIDSVNDDQRRQDCRDLAALMEEISGQPPKMWGTSIVGFGQYHYKYDSGREGDSLLTGFSPRKQELVLYLGSGLENAALMASLGKHKAGKGCLYLKRLGDVDRDVLRRLIQESVTAMRQRYPG